MSLPTKKRSVHQLLLIAALATPIGTALSQEAADFDVPAQEASSGLSTLAIQGNFELLIPPRLVQGRSIHQVHGHYTPASALDKAMHGSGLTYKAVSASAYVVQAEGPAPAVRNGPIESTTPQQVSSTDPAIPTELEGVTVSNHTLKTAEYGQAELFSINGADPLPLDKSYEQLTNEQRQLYRSWYSGLGTNDDPPFPEGGLMKLFERTVSMHYPQAGHFANHYNVEGLYFILVHVDEHGRAHSAEISEVGNFEPDEFVKRFLGTVFLSQKYRPGRCNGIPCAMDFGVSINMIPPGH